MATTLDYADDMDPRRAAILGAAFDTFCLYGFRRTAMEDIARASGQSRAALYLHFPNKQAIYRALIEHYFTMTEARMRAVLAPGMDAAGALEAAFAAKAGPEIAAMLASPHGGELLDANAAVAADLVPAGEGRLADVLAEWLDSEAHAGRIRLTEPAAELARTLFAALGGLKAGCVQYADFRAAAARLARVVGRGLAAG